MRHTKKTFLCGKKHGKLSGKCRHARKEEEEEEEEEEEGVFSFLTDSSFHSPTKLFSECSEDIMHFCIRERQVLSSNEQLFCYLTILFVYIFKS